ncbi:hypothetical protein MKZ38_002329 [Zalerion maritima]|uniref:Sucrose transporter n=1 Tax=Zalerion maritima TaxID=339359 RepID=A0AAD5WVD4_9PEZI|nr:hypothetical protein MKZ38_002329 [Zalerion maritima]
MVVVDSVALIWQIRDSTMDASLATARSPRPRPGGGKVGTGKILLLTCGFFGMQLVWSVLMTNGTPYLQTLSLPASLTPLVWLAGPLSGAIFQPIIGAHSDRCVSPWGRRSPYIITGAVSTTICLLGLSFTDSVLPSVLSLVGISGRSNDAVARTLVQVAAVLWVYWLNLSLQPLQSGLRARIVDVCPPEEQARANAWASRFTGLGNVAMCAIGYWGVPAWLHVFDGNHVFRSLSIVAAAAMMATVGLSCFMVREVPLVEVDDTVEDGEEEKGGKKRMGIATVLRGLAESIRTLPRLNTRTIQDQVAAKNIDKDTTHAASMRMGNLSGFMTAVVALSVTFALPAILGRVDRTRGSGSLTGVGTGKSGSPGVACQKRTLSWAWAAAQVLLAMCMFATMFASDYVSSMAIVAMVGVSWAVTIWVPFALIATDISKLSGSEGEEALEEMLLGGHRSSGGRRRRKALGAGAVMGLHNLAIASPQIVSALVSSLLLFVFAGQTEWVLRAGGIATALHMRCASVRKAAFQIFSSSAASVSTEPTQHLKIWAFAVEALEGVLHRSTRPDMVLLGLQDGDIIKIRFEGVTGGTETIVFLIFEIPWHEILDKRFGVVFSECVSPLEG